MSFRWFGCSGVRCSVTCTVEGARIPLFQNVANSHTQYYVPEKPRPLLHRCESVKGAQTTVYYIRKQIACYINALRCFGFIIKPSSGYSKKKVSYHRAGFRAIDVWWLNIESDTCSYIYKISRLCYWYITVVDWSCLVQVCIQIQNTRHVGPYVFSYVDSCYIRLFWLVHTSMQLKIR
jgi:hypothetical protein